MTGWTKTLVHWEQGYNCFSDVYMDLRRTLFPNNCTMSVGTGGQIPVLFSQTLSKSAHIWSKLHWEKSGTKTTPGAVSWSVSKLHPWHYFGLTNSSTLQSGPVSKNSSGVKPFWPHFFLSVYKPATFPVTIITLGVGHDGFLFPSGYWVMSC